MGEDGYVSDLIDTTETYFVGFDAARGGGEPPPLVPLVEMATHVDEGAQQFRSLPRDDAIERLRVALDKMLGIEDALTEHWDPAFEYTAPRGGFFLWGSLPAGVDTLELMREGIAAGAVFVPGAAFTPVEGVHSTLRLAYSFVDEETLVEGVRRLAPVVDGAVAGRG